MKMAKIGYAAINLHALLCFVSHNESSVHGNE